MLRNTCRTVVAGTWVSGSLHTTAQPRAIMGCNRRLAGVAAHLQAAASAAPSARISRELSAEDGWQPSTQQPVPKVAVVRHAASLAPDQCEFFAEHGFLCLPSWIPPDVCANVRRDMDAHMLLRDAAGMSADPTPLDIPEPQQPPLFVSYPTDSIGGLTTYPPTMECIRTLMDGHTFALHHIHGSRMDAGAPQSPWHQVLLPRAHSHSGIGLLSRSRSVCLWCGNDHGGDYRTTSSTRRSTASFGW